MKRFSSQAKFLLIILGLFTVLSLVIFWPIFLGKVDLNSNLLVSFYSFYGQNLPFKYTGWDQLRIYFPFYKVTFDAFRHLQFPLWNPYAFSGHPHAADFQSAVFYPLNLFGLFLPQIEFWHFLRITPTILASFFTFLFLRTLKLSKAASVFGAITFGFGPFILTWGEEVVMSPHSVLWLPLILYGIEKYLDSKNKKFLAIIAFSGAFSLLAGYMQTTIYVFVFAFCYLVLKVGLRGLFRVINLKVVAAFVFSFTMASLQLFPSGELFFRAARSEIPLRETLIEALLPPETFVTYLAPDFFGNPGTANFFRMGIAQYYEGILFVGVAALVFAAYAAFFGTLGRYKKLVTFLTVFGLFALSTTFDLPSTKLFLTLPIPFLSTSIANRVLFLPAFCLSVLAAIGVEMFLVAKDRKILKVIFGFGLAYLLLFAILVCVKIFHLNYFEHAKFYSHINVVISLRNMVIPAGVFGLSALLIYIGILRSKLRNICFVLILAVAVLNIFYFSKKYFSFSERKYVFAETPVVKFIKDNQGLYRSWGVGDQVLENNFATQYGIYRSGGYDSLNNKDYGLFTYAMQGGEIEHFNFRADAGLGRGQAGDLLENSSRRRLINMLGIKYVTAPGADSGIMEKNNFVMVFEGEKLNVWENKEVMPRAFLASNYEGPPDIFLPGETKEEKAFKEKERRKLIINKLQSPDFNYRDVLVLEKPSPVSAQFGEGSARITKYEPQEVFVKTKSEEPKLLFLSDNYYPGWKATVDGDETTILRADYTFRAVPLTPGEHTVRFYYDSDIFKLGLAISLLGLGTLAYLTLVKNPLAG